MDFSLTTWFLGQPELREFIRKNIFVKNALQILQRIKQLALPMEKKNDHLKDCVLIFFFRSSSIIYKYAIYCM